MRCAAKRPSGRVPGREDSPVRMTGCKDFVAPWRIVLLPIIFFACHDELWGRLLTCGGLSIRLPHLYAPATALENRQHCLRLCRYAGQNGILRADW